MANQNGDTAGNVTNVNYFTDDQTHTGAVNSPWLSMGFRTNGSSYVNAQVMAPAAMTNGLLVRIGIQPNGEGNGIVPVGNATYDAASQSYAMTYDGSQNDGGYNWKIVAGFDANSDGALQSSEIAVTSQYAIEPISNARYQDAINDLLISA